MPPIDPNNPTGSASMANLGNTRQTHTGVNNSYGGKKPGLEKEKIMVTTGVYKVRTAALECQYVGYNQDDEAECSFKAKVTIPEKWLDNLTPVSTLKAFFMKSYRKKFPEARLSKVPDEQIDVAIKDESMFLFSKQKVKDDAIIKTTFYDRQEVYAMGPADWEEMAAKLKEYRRVIVRSLAHCHRSQTDSWEYVTPVTSSRQLTSTNSYVVLVGWYKMQCVIVQPHFTIADLKVYLHEKNGTRMPLECIDIGLRSGDDINIIDDALTLQDVYERTKVEGADYTGPGTFADYEAKVEERKRLEELEQKAEEEIEANKDKRGPDSTYFRRHDTTSRVHADWDDEDSKLKTFSIEDQPHSKAAAESADLSDVIGPQKPMHLRTTHAPPESKYAHLSRDPLIADGYITNDGEYAERPRIKAADDDDKSRFVEVEEVPEGEVAGGEQAAASASAAGAQTLAGLEPEDVSTPDPQPPPPPPTAVAPSVPSFTGKTMVLGVGKRIQDVKYKIWVATVHDPYSFRGPEDKASGGGAKDSLALQQNGAPKGWSAPAEGEASVNQDENCSIM